MSDESASDDRHVEGGTVAWSEFLAEASRRLTAAGIETAVVDARRIVEEVSGADSAEFHSMLGEPATQRGVARFDSLLSRREAGEPLQYVLGRWGFRYLDLMVDDRVLVPRPETEVVAGLALAEVVRIASTEQVNVADLGTGSGAIGLAVASEFALARVHLADISDDALAVARANLSGIGRSATRVSIHQGSWFEALPGSLRGHLDVIVSNPPYIADSEVLPRVVGDWEPTGALRAGPDGTEALEHLVELSPEWLAPRGSLVLEMAPHQTSRIATLCESTGFIASIHQDLAGLDRAVVARMSR